MQQVVGKRGVYRVDIIGDPADDISGLVGVKIPYRQFGEPVKYLLSHLIDDLLAQVDHQNGEQVGKSGGQGVKADHQRAEKEYCGKIGLPRPHADGVDSPAGQIRPQKGQKIAGYGEQDRPQRHPFMGIKISPKAQKHFFSILGLFGKSPGASSAARSSRRHYAPSFAIWILAISR